jgi:hypothetical protein
MILEMIPSQKSPSQEGSRYSLLKKKLNSPTVINFSNFKCTTTIHFPYQIWAFDLPVKKSIEYLGFYSMQSRRVP